MKSIYIGILLSGIVLALTGCEKLISVDSPKNQLTTDKIFADSATATVAILNAYSCFETRFDPNYTPYVGLYTDELSTTSSNTMDAGFLAGILNVENGYNLNTWASLYEAIYQCNDVLAQVKDNKALSKTFIIQMSCEAKFLRAFAYYYLVNLYGEVPLILQTDVSVTAKAAKVATPLIYNQITVDLVEAKAGLPVTYIGTGKVRANKWAVTALLARVLLDQKKWDLAEHEAGELIGSGMYTPLGSLDGVFKAGSKEAVLQLWNQNGFVKSNVSLIPASSTSIPGRTITAELFAAFEAGDLRKTVWTGTVSVISNNVSTDYTYSYKYKNRVANSSSPEYLTVLRSAEQYLIRAEARAMLDAVPLAVQDLNVVRKRAGLKPLPETLSQLACLTAISKERRVELFAENGHRFFDLRRSGEIDAVMSIQKSTWKKGISQLWPIPLNEITYNPNLKQNTGY